MDNVDAVIRGINEQFYKDYDVSYFYDKGILLCGMIASPKDIKNLFSKGYSVGKIKVDKASLTQKWLVSFAKRENVVNSYHCIESFFRLFFAHVEEPECPWIGVEQLQDFRKFKGRIEQLRSRTYFKTDHNQSVASLILGERAMYKSMTDEQWEKNVEKTVELIDRLAGDILKNQDYNVHKHGAALLDTKFGFTLGEPTAPIMSVKRQEAFMYISSDTEKTKNGKITRFSRTYKFMRWQQRFASTVLASQLMNNLLVIRQAQLGLAAKKYRLFSFHTYDFHKMLSTGITPETVSESMFERHYGS